ncbi:MAG: anhydro-N-acetylmuramic acid kinase [Leptothrix ochracea]|uniref:anhydro-N-acetylmuramic acid kinase n=1 Tax=Leptothrix ochracea TaxID=735331 RepID=UPI0034E2D41F
MNTAPHAPYFIGLMSGTSLDGVDGVLCQLGTDGTWQGLLAHAHRPFSPTLYDALQALQAPGMNELHRGALAGNALARVYAETCAALLEQTGLGPQDIRAIGAHGQTVRHQPGMHDGTGYTVQLLQGALLAELSGIDVVADLRSRDLAAGGQGAPLVPPFHQALFGRGDRIRGVVNIGGISNITLLRPHQSLIGFDCGPGNTLLDHWCQTHRQQPFDRNGAWAAQGRVDPALLDHLHQETFFALPAPKSTGRDLFNAAWLAHKLDTWAEPISATDVQATLTELTARSIANELLRYAADVQDVLVCGGGAFNTHLMQRLQAALPQAKVLSTAEEGLAPDHVEAAAFAWLAWAHTQHQPGNHPSVTGAKGFRVLGALHPA